MEQTQEQNDITKAFENKANRRIVKAQMPIEEKILRVIELQKLAKPFREARGERSVVWS